MASKTDIRFCLNCDRATLDTPCPYCGGGVFRNEDSIAKWENAFDKRYPQVPSKIGGWEKFELVPEPIDIKKFIQDLLNEQHNHTIGQIDTLLSVINHSSNGGNKMMTVGMFNDLLWELKDKL